MTSAQTEAKSGGGGSLNLGALEELRSVSWTEKLRMIRIIDQRKLPAVLEYIYCASVEVLSRSCMYDFGQ